MKKYSIIMPYYNRISQLVNTLQSFAVWYANRKDYEVVLVEDGKNSLDLTLHNALHRVVEMWSEKINIVWFSPSDEQVKHCYNPAPIFNKGVSLARGKYLIITNPECKHNTDILSGLDVEFGKDPEVYVVCGCQSMHSDGKFHMWYQHSIYRNARYHFCSAVSREKYLSVGGFDERYADGYCFEDNAFRDSLIKNGVRFVLRDDLLTTHQWHEEVKPDDWKDRWQRNKELYESEVVS